MTLGVKVQLVFYKILSRVSMHEDESILVFLLVSELEAVEARLEMQRWRHTNLPNNLKHSEIVILVVNLRQLSSVILLEILGVDPYASLRVWFQDIIAVVDHDIKVMSAFLVLFRAGAILEDSFEGVVFHHFAEAVPPLNEVVCNRVTPCEAIFRCC